MARYYRCARRRWATSFWSSGAWCALAGVLLPLDADSTNVVRRVVIFEAAMGRVIGAAIVADHFKLDTEITALMVAVGIPLSLAAPAMA